MTCRPWQVKYLVATYGNNKAVGGTYKDDAIVWIEDGTFARW